MELPHPRGWFLCTLFRISGIASAFIYDLKIILCYPINTYRDDLHRGRGLL